MVKDATRCTWCGSEPLYVAYHDEEWGVPVTDEQALFERLMLEGMQAGLSWWTVLKKREHMRSVFYDFDPHKLARYGGRRMDRWLADAGLIRHRGKLDALVTNARAYLDLPDNFSALLWTFAPDTRDAKAVPSETPESRAMSKALKKAGFRFVGPTICYAFMQSVGMVNDHHPECFRFTACDTAVRRQLARR